MPQTIVLAAGTAGGTSSNIVVPAGAEVVVGAFAASGALSDTPNYFAAVQQVTPGVPNQICTLDASAPSMLLAGPATYQVVSRSSINPVGIFTE